MYVQVKASNNEDAIKNSGLKLGQLAQIKKLNAHGNLQGDWTVFAEFEMLEPDHVSNIYLEREKRRQAQTGTDET